MILARPVERLVERLHRLADDPAPSLSRLLVAVRAAPGVAEADLPVARRAVIGLLGIVSVPIGRACLDAIRRATSWSVLIHALATACADGGDRRPDPRVREALGLLEPRALARGGDTRLAGVAGEVGLSPWRLSALVRRATGEGWVSHIRRMRVAEAAHLMATSRAPLARIAARAGYSDASALSRDFRRALGMTPGAYARAIRRRPRRGDERIGSG